MPGRALLVYNPRAGNRGPSRCLPLLITRMESWGWDVRSVACEGADTTEAVRGALREGVDTIVSAGGDGTAHLLANTMVGSNARLAVLPCGTANDFARALRLPMNPLTALEQLREGHTTRIDLGWVNGHYFLNVASIGVAADVAHAVTPERKHRWGRWVYLLEVARHVVRPQAVPVTLCLQGRCDRLEAYQISVANGCCFGGGFRVSAEAALDEGLLDVIVVEPGFWNLAKGALRLHPTLMGHLGSRSCRTTELTIETPTAILANLDGESVVLEPPLCFKVVPRSLEIYGGRP